MRGERADRLYRAGVGLLAGAVPVALGAIAVFVLVDALPALRYMGLGFWTGTQWNLGNQYGGTTASQNGVVAAAGATFGILPYILGTLLTSAVALAVALPLGVGAALFLSEYAPPRLRLWLSSLVELLAGVPSVVYGLWGLAVVVPAVAGGIGPWLSAALGFIPFLRGPVGTGLGLLSAGLVLAVMVLPLIAATARDAMQQTPRALREGAVALGLTRWEAIAGVVLPTARPAIFGAAILALGRALGETMAVLMVSGGSINLLPTNLYGPVNTLAAVIASQLDAAFTDATHMALHALAGIALTLFVISLVVNGTARLIVRREGAA
ncbi:MAG: phosphate ABC transporter permease subunit PstC [Firmicutes bacterium]|nr:phosphate ABC transporter permease subunit PstC [Bacillota bacterium]